MNGQENSVPVSRSESRPPAVAANVGVIFYSPMLTPILSAKLRDKLKALHHSRAVVRVLHHGGGRGLDETALRIARDLGGWQDRAHADGDTGVARASSILIAVGPRPERNAESSGRAAAWRDAIRHARAAHANIVYLDDTGQRTRAGKPGKAPHRQPKRAAVTRNPPPQASKPSRGGASPARASRTCRRCKQPVPASRERWGWLCENCERRPRRVYTDPRDARLRVPPSKSVRAVSAGLPGLGKRR
jgi:hypothetical protein